MSNIASTLAVGICLPSPHDPPLRRGPTINTPSVDTEPARPNPSPPLTDKSIDWDGLGLLPRWLGDDTSQAVAILEPSVFSNTGAREVHRYLAGCGQRGEMALAVSTVGGGETATMRALQLGLGISALTDTETTISAGAALTLAAAPDLAPGLVGADRDLAMRVRNVLGAGASWWPIHLSGSTLFTVMSGPDGQEVEPTGALSPLLTSAAGEIVAAVWTSSNGSAARHYVLPSSVAWRSVLEWLPTAVAEFIPNASARTRAGTAELPELQTAREIAARVDLEQAEQDWARRHRQLIDELNTARAEADAVRDPLLHGHGKDLESAVAHVLRDAGLDVTNIDDLLGSTDCADLLVSNGSERILVEIKGVSGRARERLVDDLLRHIRTWPLLRADLPAPSGALVLNHQRTTPPNERDAQPYSRREFVASLPVPVLTTRELLDAWGRRDGPGIADLLFSGVASFTNPGAATAPATEKPSNRVTGRRRRPWTRGDR